MAPHSDLELSPALDADTDRLGDVLSHAFGFPRDEASLWFERAGIENLRVLKRGGVLRGGLVEIPMGQWFGGRSVTMMGVAGVGVVPEERGRGVAAHMMVSMLREARARGFALSTLYPASVTLYRRAGYERAGARFAISFDPRMLDLPRVPEVTVGEVSGTPEDVVALYGATAPRFPGYIDRGPYVWTRVSKPRGHVTKTFTVSHGGALEGYVVVSHAMGGADTSVLVTDLAATTSRAARAILRLLAEYRSLATVVKWHGGPSDLFTNLLPERHHTVSITDSFMLRIVDVARALSLRGWPRGAGGSLTLEVDDASMPENSGLYAVTLEGGRATVATGRAAAGAPRAKLTERGLAALYAGHAPAHVLADAGWLEADDAARVLLDAWFAGAYPSMRDFF
ncbi:MAG: GNAT family N-acetyltransferase [Labilithrix sp.]|nr:GNAT family N-acetyltransferase [Labilithrix sp.]